MKTKVLLVLTFSVIFTITAAAQENAKRYGLEISAGPSIATREFTDGVRMGFGFDGTLHYRFMPHMGVYTGWGENWFSTESSSEQNNKDYEETGYVLGLQFKHPLQDGRTSYFLRVGALYNHIEIENENGDITEDTGHGPGFQLAAGFDISLGSSWSLTPVVKFNSLTRSLNSEATPTKIRFEYLTARIGILKTF
jgi:hypothetical protein